MKEKESKTSWQEEFDERFDSVYYGKDIDGVPIYPPDGFKEDVKSFIASTIAKELEEVREEIEGKMVRTACMNGGKPKALHVFNEPSDWRSECIRCGKEKGDTEDISLNSALSDLKALIQSHIEQLRK